jgi:hypothetical protein
VVAISITNEALAAIEATLLKGFEAECLPGGKGGYRITLPRRLAKSELCALARTEL